MSFDLRFVVERGAAAIIVALFFASSLRAQFIAEDSQFVASDSTGARRFAARSRER
ncbi:MAG: hypothetical protein R3F34_10270 [Planctomycetota bacterium]